MHICKKCIQPDTRPKIFFKDGICGACLWEEEKKGIDWEKREKELQDIADLAKKKSTTYDCVIGVSGGKDSTKQALTARDRLGLRCLLVNGEPEGITEIGRHNIENLKNLGFDVISLRPNPKIMKKLVKRDFYKFLNPVKVTEYALWSSAYIIADQFDIPLIIQGENVGLTLGTSLAGVGKGFDALTINEVDTLSTPWKDYTDVEEVSEKDLFMYHYDRTSLQNRGIRGVFIQYFLKEWSFRNNAEFSMKYGFKGKPDDFKPEEIGTYIPFAQVDAELNPVNQLLKYIKLGFGQCLDHACYDLRDGRITKEQAIEYVKKYDGKCGEYYIENLCNYIEISKDEFWKVANQFRGPMWIKKNDNEWHNTFLDMLEKEKY